MIYDIYTKIRLGWKTRKYYYETDQLPNPRNGRLKVAFGPLFPTAFSVPWVRIGFIQETNYKKQPNQIVGKQRIMTY